MKRITDKIDSGFQSSSGVTSEWKSFVTKFRNDLGKELDKVGAENYTMSRGHFYVSGFFQLGEQWYYFSISDVRFFPDKRMLIRTADHPKDYTGGRNEYVNIETNMFLKYFHRPTTVEVLESDYTEHLESKVQHLKAENERLQSQINKPNEPDFDQIGENALNQAVRYIQNSIGEDSGHFARTWDFDEVEKVLTDYAKNNYYYLNYK